jgi:hypothetical protein
MLREFEIRHVGAMAWEDESTTLGTQTAVRGFGNTEFVFLSNRISYSKLMSIKSNN